MEDPEVKNVGVDGDPTHELRCSVLLLGFEILRPKTRDVGVEGELLSDCVMLSGMVLVLLTTIETSFSVLADRVLGRSVAVGDPVTSSGGVSTKNIKTLKPEKNITMIFIT